MTDPSELRWLNKLDECDLCAVWIGPHQHLLRDDGTVGVVVRRLPPDSASPENDR